MLARLDQLDRLTEPAAASARPAPTPGPGHPRVHAGHGRPPAGARHCLSEVLSPHCPACGGAGCHVLHLPGGSPAFGCAACGGRATIGVFVVALVALAPDGRVRWRYDFAGADTTDFARAAERARTAARWVGALTVLPSLSRELRVIHVGGGAGGRDRVVVREPVRRVG